TGAFGPALVPGTRAGPKASGRGLGHRRVDGRCERRAADPGYAAEELSDKVDREERRRRHDAGRRAKAAVRPLRRVLAQPGFDGIEHDVSHGVRQVVLVLDQRRGEAMVERMTG